MVFIVLYNVLGFFLSVVDHSVFQFFKFFYVVYFAVTFNANDLANKFHGMLSVATPNFSDTDIALLG